MSNPPGAGTLNLSINIPIEERDVWGKVAFKEGISIGELWRRASAAGLALVAPKEARTIQQIRESRRKMKAGVMLAMGLFVVSLEIFGVTNHDIARAKNGRAKGAKTQKGKRAELEIETA